MFRELLIWLTTVGISLSVLNCTSSETIKPKYVRVYQDKDIVVFLKDGEEISFKAGKYVIVEKSGQSFLKGSGVVISQVRSKQFEGEIDFDEIEKIGVYQYSPLKTELLITGGLIIVFLVALPKNIAH